MNKSINDRCPLQVECERKKCEYVRNELACPYYSANAREGYYIYDQEAIRNRKDREAMDEALFASLDDDAENDEAAETGELVCIPIEQLYPHPDNPRKDLGDLTELADSIKANGVLQNLTVVPRTRGIPWSSATAGSRPLNWLAWGRFPASSPTWSSGHRCRPCSWRTFSGPISRCTNRPRASR